MAVVLETIGNIGGSEARQGVRLALCTGIALTARLGQGANHERTIHRERWVSCANANGGVCSQRHTYTSIMLLGLTINAEAALYEVRLTAITSNGFGFVPRDLQSQSGPAPHRQ